jgi:hypothetical protein
LSVGHGGQADDGIIAQRCDGFQHHLARALHSPFIVLLEQDCADQTGDGGLVGEDADDVCGSLDLAQAADPVRQERIGVSEILTRGIG